MALTHFYAALFGILFLGIGIGMLFNRRDMLAVFEEMAKSRVGVFTFAIINTLLGVTIILTHNVWNGTLGTTLVSLLGWLLTVRGLLLFIVPHHHVARLLERATKSAFPLITLGTILVGVYFTYVGFVK